MTDREIMQQALEDICAAKLCEFNSMSSRQEMIRLLDNAIAALRERLAQPEPDFYGYASRLAVAIWEQHYKDVAPQWKPLDDLIGVLTQIDNMTAGLTRLAQPEQEEKSSTAGYVKKIESLIAERDALRSQLAQPRKPTAVIYSPGQLAERGLTHGDVVKLIKENT